MLTDVDEHYMVMSPAGVQPNSKKGGWCELSPRILHRSTENNGDMFVNKVSGQDCVNLKITFLRTFC